MLSRLQEKKDCCSEIGQWQKFSTLWEQVAVVVSGLLCGLPYSNCLIFAFYNCY